MWKRYRNLKKNRRAGTTLIEMIVTMSVMLIFFAGTSGILVKGYETYHNIRSSNEGIQVTDILLDKIAGELEGAQGSRNTNNQSGDISQMVFSGDSVTFEKARADKVHILVENGRLIIRHDAIKGERGSVIFNNADWTMDDKAYMGFRVENLAFYPKMQGYPENVVKVSITVQNGTNTFTNQRYIRCFNFREENEEYIKS